MSTKSELVGKRVLLVDDDQDFIFQNTLRFQQLGCQVFSAGNQVDARKTFAESNPDVVVLDLMMEEKDAGMVLAHFFKKEKPSVPVVMVTGITRETGMMIDGVGPDARSWVKADKILAKPVRFEQLIREVEILLAGK